MNSSGPRSALLGLLGAALMVLWCPPLAGQSPTTGALRGAVVEASGVSTGTVLLTLTDSAGGVHRIAPSDRDGIFRFAFLPAGEYDLVVEKLGFVPRRIRGIPVRPGRELHLELALAGTASTTPDITEETYAGAAIRGGLPGESQWIDDEIVRMAAARREALGDVLRLSSAAGGDLAAEGLPPWLSGTAMDGMRLRSAGESFLHGTEPRRASVPLHGIGSAQIAMQELDVEWRGAAGALLSANSRKGSGRTSIAAAASWSDSALPGASFADDAGSFNDVNARVTVLGPLFGDSSSYAFGLHVRRMHEPLSSAWTASGEADALVDLAAERAIDLSSNRTPLLAHDEALSAFGGFNITLTRRHQLRLGAHGSMLPRVTAFDRRSGFRSDLEGHDLVASASLLSTFSPGVGNELRLGVTSSDRAPANGDSTVPVFLVEEALSFGSLHPGSSVSGRSIEVTEALHYLTGAHALKFGIATSIDVHDFAHRAGSPGEYFFSGIDALRAGTGVFTQNAGPAPRAEWSGVTYSVFAQDIWTAITGLDVRIGLRADRVSLPVDNVSRDTEWFRLSGLANNDVAAERWLISPRVGLTWSAASDQRWVLHAAGGVYHGDADPLLLSEWQVDNGTARTVRIVGDVSWPDSPATGGGVPRLTMLASSFAPPQTTRVTAGIAHSLDARTAVQLSGVVRRTVNLPRRTDLNRLPLPAARDQYDRPIYGVLVKQRGLLAQEPGTGRRFSEYDEVAAVSADGESDHWGVTFGLERDLAAGLGFLARYTFARTTDNWLAAAEGGWTVPLPQEPGGDWADGTSDFDVPHRLSAALFYRAPFGLELTGVYNLASGLPFTPGFRPGVDANADGSARNDPAFVDGSLAGMDELMARWPCLRAADGAHAARNSCRTDPVHALDLRAAVTVLRLGRAAAALSIEAFDLLEGAHTVPDAALYLIDPAGDLVIDTAARTVTVPLVVNDEFGTALTRRHSGRKLRLGVSLNW